MDEQKKLAVGLDIGTDTIRIVVGHLQTDNISIVEAIEAPSFGVKRGVISSLDSVAEQLDKILGKVEKAIGQELKTATVNIDGASLQSLEIDGMIATTSPQQEITFEEVERLKEVAALGKISNNRHILEILPYEYIIDGQTSVKDPIGMSGMRLEIKANVISALSPYVNNLKKALEKADFQFHQIIPAPVAAAELVLDTKQRENGVMVIDLGSATTGIAIYEDDELRYVAVLPVGGNQITNDLAIGLMVDPETAEQIKRQYADAEFKKEDKQVSIKINKISQKFNLNDVDEIVEARLDEIFQAVYKHLRQSKYMGKLPNGVILTGGGSKLKNIDSYIQSQLKLATKIAKPHYKFTGLTEKIADPEFTSAVGLMLIDAHQVDEYIPNGHHKNGWWQSFWKNFKK